ncbi:hypothetical protein EVAR_77806_1 [Eumeta japonica]|uniref:Uncharacterized protein n=1 Tax=Eumeta variegata TaxID=151549 RepID=A0A4C1TE18_EUMVA|nr:hypothetical protein EVAR_77806_1 [Eumeta japonica]
MLKASPRKINNCVKRLSALFPVVKQSASEPSRRSVPACRTDQTLQKTIQKSSQNGLGPDLPYGFLGFSPGIQEAPG